MDQTIFRKGIIYHRTISDFFDDDFFKMVFSTINIDISFLVQNCSTQTLHIITRFHLCFMVTPLNALFSYFYNGRKGGNSFNIGLNER